MLARPAFARSTQKPGVRHSERIEDACLQEHVERTTGQLLDHVALDVDARAIPPVGAGLEGERKTGQRVDHPLQVTGPKRVLGVGGRHIEARRVTHQLAHRHRARRWHLTLAGRHGQAVELGNVLRHRSSRAHLPSSQSIIMATPMIGLVIDAIRKIVSFVTGARVSRSRTP